jgi:hypothetical protein
VEPAHGVVIGRRDGEVVIAFRKAMTVVQDDNGNGNGDGDNSGSQGNRGHGAGRYGNNSGPSAAGAGTGTGTADAESPRTPVVRIASPPEMSLKYEDSAV